MTAATMAHATPADLEDLCALLTEVQDFYDDAEPAETIARNTKRALFGETPYTYAILARVGSNLVGFAAYSFLWPAFGSTISLYLKEVYIREDARRLGIGRQLMDELTKIAADRQCSRIEWTTDTSNPVAQEFYASLGHQPHAGKLLYRVDLT